MVRYLGDTAGQLTAGRKGFSDFQRENEEFNARKKQRQMQEQLMPLQVEKAQLGLEKMKQDMAAPKLPFQGTAFDAQVANEAYKFNLSKGLDDAQARQKAIDMVYGSKVDYKMMPDPNNPYAPPQMRAAPRNPIFGESEQYRTPGIMPEVGASQIPPQAQMNTQSTAQPPMLPTIAAGDVGGMYAPQIDPRAMQSPDVQKDAASGYMDTNEELRKERLLAEQQAEMQRPQEINAAERAFSSGMDSAANINKVIDKSLESAGMFTTGFIGESLSNLPGTPARDLAENMKTIEADAAFSTLQAMREASKTGGALGAISERELSLLGSAKAALSTAQSPEQFRENLIRYKEVRNKALENVAEAFNQDYGYYPSGYDRFKSKPKSNDPNDLVEFYAQ